MRAELGAVPLVEMRSIAKKFGETQILRDVSFDLRAGEVHALLGENGAGKSTLMKILVGVHRPDGGEVLLSGTDVTDRTIGEKLAGGIAMIFQELSLVPNLTVAENLFLGREPLLPGWIVDNRALRRKARALLDEYDFPVSAEARVETLGFAQRQMVEIVKALASGARVLVMDEPTSSLTVEEEEKLFALIAQLKRRGIGIVYISHRMTEIFKVSDRISVMKDGRMLPPEDVGSTNRDRIALLMSRPGDRTETSAEGRGAVRPGTAPALALTGLLTQRKFREPLDLTVAAGEIVGLAGLVGSGRSTLAKAIFGLLPDAEGNLAVAGHPVRLGSPRHAVEAGIGLVPEDRRLEGLVVEHSLSRNVALASLERLARVYPIPHLSPRAGDAPYERFRRKLGILARAPQQEARELSGGNQQKVVVAKWLATSPRLLLLDEPTSGVDVNAKEDMRSFVREAARDGLGVLLIASELEELTRLADRIVTIADGRLGRELGSGIGEAELRGALQADIDARKRRNLQ